MERLAGIANTSGMDPSTQMELQEMWSMLDKMSSEDPKGYQEFISQQMNDGEKMMKEQKAQQSQDQNPKVWRIIKSSGELGRQVIVLMREHTKIESPSWSEDRVPVWVSDPKATTREDGSPVIVYDAVFHPAVKARAAADKNIQRGVICLALDAVAQTHGTLIQLKGWKVLKRAECGNELGLPFSWEAQSHGGASYGEEITADQKSLDSMGTSPLLTQLSSMTAPSTGPACKEVPPAEAPAKKPVLIEVVSETASEVKVPEYEICTEDAAVQLRVWLPGVSGVSQVDLDISDRTDPTHVAIEVEGQYELEVDLPGQLVNDQVKAKFDKATHLLVLSLPQTNERL